MILYNKIKDQKYILTIKFKKISFFFFSSPFPIKPNKHVEIIVKMKSYYINKSKTTRFNLNR